MTFRLWRCLGWFLDVIASLVLTPLNWYNLYLVIASLKLRSLFIIHRFNGDKVLHISAHPWKLCIGFTGWGN